MKCAWQQIQFQNFTLGFTYYWSTFMWKKMYPISLYCTEIKDRAPDSCMKVLLEIARFKTGLLVLSVWEEAVSKTLYSTE